MKTTAICRYVAILMFLSANVSHARGGGVGIFAKAAIISHVVTAQRGAATNVINAAAGGASQSSQSTDGPMKGIEICDINGCRRVDWAWFRRTNFYCPSPNANNTACETIIDIHDPQAGPFGGYETLTVWLPIREYVSYAKQMPIESIRVNGVTPSNYLGRLRIDYSVLLTAIGEDAWFYPPVETSIFDRSLWNETTIPVTKRYAYDQFTRFKNGNAMRRGSGCTKITRADISNIVMFHAWCGGVYVYPKARNVPRTW